MVSVVYNITLEPYARRLVELQQMPQPVKRMMENGRFIRTIAPALGVHECRVYWAAKALATGFREDNLTSYTLAASQTA